MYGTEDQLQMICIYCLEDLPSNGFRGTEHVIPESLGVFENNLTLNGVVCDGCNQLFGDTIDLMLGRGSSEAVHRLNYGAQPPEKALHLRRDRVRFAFKSEDSWDGLLLELRPEAGSLAVQPIPQVGFWTQPEGPFVFVSEEELLRIDTPLPTGVDAANGMLLVADSDTTQQRLIGALSVRGISFREERRAPIPVRPGELLPVEVRSRLDLLVLRCVAKIALNYLALAEGRDFVLGESFCPLRRLVRLGARAPYPLVVVDDLPILADDDQPRLRQTNGHLITVGWAADRRSLVAQVGLFNHARYRISLARDYSGLWRPIRHGHHFNIETRRVETLVASSLAT